MFQKMLLAVLCLFSLDGYTQNIELISNVSISENCSDIWGYVDSVGLEYAVIGTFTSTKIYSLENPSEPVLRASISGAPSSWRDIKYFDKHIYVVADKGNDGLLVIDMTKAPDTISHSFYKPQIDLTNQKYILDRCHNIYIDEGGYAYLAGCNYSDGGVLIFDLNQNREEPVYIGAENDNYAHDVYVQDNKMVTSDIYAGTFALWDVTDKTNPIKLGEEVTSSFFTHNAWFSADGNFVYTTDERGNGFVDSYDISDLDNITRLDKFKPLETKDKGVIPHNTHFLNDFLYTSWYTDGVVITDATHPDNLIQIGQYDSFSGGNGGYHGCWGAYPFLPSGLLLASDINTGLYILRPQVTKACYLEGKAVDYVDSLAINNVQISILSEEFNEGVTNALGNYKTGVATAGLFKVIAIHPDYNRDTVELSMMNGEVRILDFQLRKKSNYLLNGRVLDSNNNPIANAQVSVQSEDNAYLMVTNEKGEFRESVLQGEYEYIIGAWGYKYSHLESINILEDTSFDKELELGYMDDFIMDFGWESVSKARSGAWVRGIPKGTFSQGYAINPSVDVDGDIGSYCYITGNKGNGAGTDDIDGGRVYLSSQVMDLSRYKNPSVNFQTWFVNGGGDSDPNDFFDVFISNMVDTILLERNIFDFSLLTWSDVKSYQVNNYFDVTDKIQLIFVAADDDPGHLSEAGLDHFFVSDEFVSEVKDIEKEVFVNVYPNPVSDILKVTYDTNIDLVLYTIIDINGKRVLSNNLFAKRAFALDISHLSNGVFIIELEDKKGIVYSQKFIVAR